MRRDDKKAAGDSDRESSGGGKKMTNAIGGVRSCRGNGRIESERKGKKGERKLKK